MKRNYKAVWGALFFLSFYLSAPFPVRAGTSTEQLRSMVDGVLAILNNPNLKSEARREERLAQLRRVIYPRFDFAEMAKRSLGPHWQRRTPEERQEFVKIFTDLLEQSYVDTIESYNGEKVVYTNEVQEKDYAEVDTKVVARKGEEFSVNYKLHLVNGGWKVYDVVIEKISLVNNYRSQFNRTITTASYEELVRRMKEKQIESPAKKKSKVG
ncbi:MAG: ABC transporter substrate-binding protein [Deltaproteobacteria bacterium]|nr:ABC transporter substrate-binding protein [Deltaproteobacteria bacterium]